MRYQYTAVFRVKGVSLEAKEAAQDQTILDKQNGVTAFLTSQIDKHVIEGDRRAAVTGMLLDSIFAARSMTTSDERRARIATAVDERKADRQRRLGTGPFLVISIDDELNGFQPEYMQDLGEFVVSLDDGQQTAIDACEGQVTALLTALASELPDLATIEKIDQFVVFRQADEKPLYSFSINAGQANIYRSVRLSEECAQAIGRTCDLFVKQPQLARVQRLIRDSFESSQDKLRSFLSAWSAFEILVNKAFGTYESKYFEAKPARGTQAEQRFTLRIREVMKDKYRLVDKFIAMNLQLDPENSDADLETAVEAKRLRDELLHGQEVDETMLPVARIRSLASKYLRLHVLAMS